MTVAYRCRPCGLKIEWPLKSVSVPCPNCGSSNWWPAQPSYTAVSAVRLDALEAKVENLLKAQDERVGKFPETLAERGARDLMGAMRSVDARLKPSMSDPNSWPSEPSPYGWSPGYAALNNIHLPTVGFSGYGEPPLGSPAHKETLAIFRELDRKFREAYRGAELPPKRHARSGYAPPSFNPIKWWGMDKPGYSPEWIAFDEAATISDEAWKALKTAVPGGVTWTDEADEPNEALVKMMNRHQPWSLAVSEFAPFVASRPKKKRVANPRRQSKAKPKRKK